ncbi:MAG: TonB-dependent receptor [Flavobacterium stagni]
MSLRAQTGDFVLLVQVLKQIEKQHNVEFSYVENEVNGLKVIPPNSKLPLNEKLTNLAQQTQLTFNRINNKYISISDNKKIKIYFKGYLKDVETKQPIESATITLHPSEQVIISNSSGYFQISEPTTSSITITHVNHDPLIIEDLSPQNTPIFYLKTKTTQLEEVDTQIILTRGVTKKWDSGYEIKPKQFGLLPGLTEADVFESIKQIPGVISSDETLSNLNIRGGNQDQILFQWNGMRLYQVSHFFGLLSAINPNLAHKINIVKNGSSPYYGGSVSGVVDISTLPDNKKEEKVSFGVNMINVDATFRHRFNEKTRLALSARRSITDILNTPTYQNYYNRVFQNTVVTDLLLNGNIAYTNDLKFYFMDVSGQLAQRISPKVELFVDFLLLTNQLNLTQSRTENAIFIKKSSSLDQETTGGIVTSRIQWNPKLKSDYRLFFSQYELYSNYESLNSTQTHYQRNEIQHLGIDLKNKYTLNSNTSLDFGYQFDEIGNQNINRINSPVINSDVKYVLRNHALIGDLKWELPEKNIKTSFGIRQNYFERWGVFITEPRINIAWQPNARWQFEFNGEIKNQTVSKIVDRQQDFLGIEKRRWILSNNSDIPILKNRQLSAGGSYRFKGWLISNEFFIKKVIGITARSQGFQNQYENLNFTGDYFIWGSEFLIQHQWKNIIVWATYSYNNNNYTFKINNNNVQFPSNNEIMHHWATGIVYDTQKMKLTLGGKWFTGRPTTLPQSQNLQYDPNTGASYINFNAPNSSHLPNFIQINASGSYVFPFKEKQSLTLGASILNILNTRNKINQFYRINTNVQSIEEINTYSLERTINVFVRYTL